MKLPLISFSGAQSSGKSTLLEKCKEIYGDQFDYVEEITRKIKKQGIAINEQGTETTQLLVIGSHIENIAYQKRPTILDRCMLDGYVYTDYMYYVRKQVPDWVYSYAVQSYYTFMPRYDLIFYTDPNIPLVDDGVRSADVEFRNTIIAKFRRELTTFDLCMRSKAAQGKRWPEVVILTGSVEERMQQIKSTLQLKFNINPL